MITDGFVRQNNASTKNNSLTPSLWSWGWEVKIYGLCFRRVLLARLSMLFVYFWQLLEKAAKYLTVYKTNLHKQRLLIKKKKSFISCGPLWLEIAVSSLASLFAWMKKMMRSSESSSLTHSQLCTFRQTLPSFSSSGNCLDLFVCRSWEELWASKFSQSYALDID